MGQTTLLGSGAEHGAFSASELQSPSPAIAAHLVQPCLGHADPGSAITGLSGAPEMRLPEPSTSTSHGQAW